MHVLHLGKILPPPFGGIETHIDALLRELNKTICANLVVAGTGLRQAEVLRDGYSAYQLPSLATVNRTSIMPTFPFWLRQYVKKNKVDLLHVHLPNPMADLAVKFVPREIPVVAMWHSDILAQRWSFPLYRPLLDSLLRRVRFLMAPTPKHFSASNQIAAVEDSRKLVVVPYGIDDEPLQKWPGIDAEIRTFRARFPCSKLVLGIGRHVPYKGFRYLISAAPLLDESIGVVIGGEGPITEELHSQIRNLSVAGRVHLIGRLAPRELAVALHACDIFCLPSVTQAEAFGIATAEAMLCEKPAVCCELHNGVSYLNVAEVTSLVVPPRNPEALAAAINRLARDDQLARQLGANGRKRVLEHFSISKLVEGTLRVYGRTLEGTRKTTVASQ